MMDAHGGIGIVVRIDPSEPAQARYFAEHVEGKAA
jgi:hypothetical protein